MPMTPLERLRRHAVARNFFAPTTLPRAIAKLGFVQADPIRAPARAQDLTLRQRVADYRAGDLERRYPKLPIEEDFFVNYGFVPRALHQLMHPRTPRSVWPKARWKQAHAVLEFVHERGVVHPRDVDDEFAHGKTTNWLGGSSNASTQLLDGMHYRGLLRVARREGGIRLYAARELTPPPADPRAAHDALIDTIVAKYAPLPFATLGQLLSHLGSGVPQWRGERGAALSRARARLAHERIDGVDWYWPDGERLKRGEPEDRVRLLAPFDPLVWDRRRFELFWGWAYRFEAYTPAPKRQLGYYALPLLWRDEVIGWANSSLADGRLSTDFGYVAGRAPREAAFRRELEAEVERLRTFLVPR
ncbi:MAG: crosslink repair DNA glycosylase YcaQ family protein [Piscinibacter sp.]|uniref:DNA glycosylase AlkZ-like family protein n=1 Tax=Piscinibacter sp. TaxID=1903157 RepID=UPI003D0FA110